MTQGFTNPQVQNPLPAGLTIPQPKIQGVTDASNAAAGYVGEVISSVLLIGSEITLSSLVAANITSLSLTPGDFDVWGEVWFDAAGTTSVSSIAGAINTVSATFPTVPAVGTSVACIAFTGLTEVAAGVQQTCPIQACQININATTTIYLNARSGFSISTMKAYGKIMARRRR
jgi:hypothetical protein